MYNWDKSVREEKLKKKTRNPSFSSTLLDEICRSIDGGGERKSEEVKIQRDRSSKKQSNNGGGGGGGNLRSKTSLIGDEETEKLRRACLINKWIHQKVNEKANSNQKSQSLHEFEKTSQILYNDPLFFSSSSSSSDSSFGGFSSSETEFYSKKKSRVSSSAPPKPKPIRTNVSVSSQKSTKASSYDEHREFFMFDDYHKNQEDIIKSKSKALKIYANLKKVKQPISPGGKLASFINSLFTHGNNAKKPKNSSSVSSYDDSVFEKKSKSTQTSSYSSAASSYYRSCLSKSSPNSRVKINNGVKRTVQFYPVGVIVDKDSRPCGQKCIYQENYAKSESKVEEAAGYILKQNQKKGEFMLDIDDDDDDDAASDTSSDLFELDHLAFIGDNRYCEELPVYETTHFDRNLAIANGLIC